MHIVFCIFIFIHAFSVILQVLRASETEISEKAQPPSNVAYNEVLLLIEEIVHSVMLAVNPIETQCRHKLASINCVGVLICAHI